MQLIGAHPEYPVTEIRTTVAPDSKPAVEAALAQLLESNQFRRSQRSRLFLQMIVQKVLAGEQDCLKERILGIELFGRDPMFDTDRDSVVRVAANDVRKRLQEYYHTNPEARVRICLPSGHYIPTIEFLANPEPEHRTQAEAVPARAEATPVIAIPSRIARSKLQPMAAGLLFLALGLAFWGVWRGSAKASASNPIAQLPPWSAMLHHGKRIDLVVADANLVAAKVALNKDVPVEQYATHKFTYLPDMKGQIGAYLNQIPLTTVSDAATAALISELATKAGSGVDVRYSSRLSLSALKSDSPLILLGSPTSNPWVQFLYDQLNFQLVHQFDTGMDVCINRKPESGEMQTYVPVRNPGGVSQGYAVITMVPNLTGKGSVLIIAGTSTEATEAAVDFVSNYDLLSRALKPVLAGTPSPKVMELLIRTTFVSGEGARPELVAHRIR